jgi:hypothetical protein
MHQGLQYKTPAEIKATLLNNVQPLSDLSNKVKSGGIMDLSFLGEHASPPELPPNTPIPTPVVICPQKPPYVVVSPPAYFCPQEPYRLWSR